MDNYALIHTYSLVMSVNESICSDINFSDSYEKAKIQLKMEVQLCTKKQLGSSLFYL